MLHESGVTAGTDATGGGGGGSVCHGDGPPDRFSGGDGGDGVVLIAYPE